MKLQIFDTVSFLDGGKRQQGKIIGFEDGVVMVENDEGVHEVPAGDCQHLGDQVSAPTASM